MSDDIDIGSPELDPEKIKGPRKPYPRIPRQRPSQDDVSADLTDALIYKIKHTHEIKRSLLFQRGLTYVTQIALLGVLYLVVLAEGELILQIISLVAHDSIDKYPIVGQAFSFLKIGLAFMTFILGFAHIGISTAKLIIKDLKEELK